MDLLLGAGYWLDPTLGFEGYNFLANLHFGSIQSDQARIRTYVGWTVRLWPQIQTPRQVLVHKGFVDRVMARSGSSSVRTGFGPFFNP